MRSESIKLSFILRTYNQCYKLLYLILLEEVTQFT